MLPQTSSAASPHKFYPPPAFCQPFPRFLANRTVIMIQSRHSDKKSRRANALHGGSLIFYAAQSGKFTTVISATAFSTVCKIRSIFSIVSADRMTSPHCSHFIQGTFLMTTTQFFSCTVWIVVPGFISPLQKKQVMFIPLSFFALYRRHSSARGLANKLSVSIMPPHGYRTLHGANGQPDSRPAPDTTDIGSRPGDIQ